MAPHEVDKVQSRMSPAEMRMAPKEVRVRVTRSRMTPSSLIADAEQYERVQTPYTEVGCDFHEQEDLLGSDYRKLQRLEMVPQRWPLARLLSLHRSVLTILIARVAGCCWEGSMQHGQIQRNQYLLSARRRRVRTAYLVLQLLDTAHL